MRDFLQARFNLFIRIMVDVNGCTMSLFILLDITCFTKDDGNVLLIEFHVFGGENFLIFVHTMIFIECIYTKLGKITFKWVYDKNHINEITFFDFWIAWILLRTIYQYLFEHCYDGFEIEVI